MTKNHTSTSSDESEVRDDARTGADAAAEVREREGEKSPEQRLADGETGDGDGAAGLRAAIDNSMSGTERRD